MQERGPEALSKKLLRLLFYSVKINFKIRKGTSSKEVFIRITPKNIKKESSMLMFSNYCPFLYALMQGMFVLILSGQIFSVESKDIVTNDKMIDWVKSAPWLSEDFSDGFSLKNKGVSAQGTYVDLIANERQLADASPSIEREPAVPLKSSYFVIVYDRDGNIALLRNPKVEALDSGTRRVYYTDLEIPEGSDGRLQGFLMGDSWKKSTDLPNVSFQVIGKAGDEVVDSPALASLKLAGEASVAFEEGEGNTCLFFPDLSTTTTAVFGDGRMASGIGGDDFSANMNAALSKGEYSILLNGVDAVGKSAQYKSNLKSISHEAGKLMLKATPDKAQKLFPSLKIKSAVLIQRIKNEISVQHGSKEAKTSALKEDVSK